MAELRGEIGEAMRSHGLAPATMTAEALEWRDALALAADPDARDILDDQIAGRAQEIDAKARGRHWHDHSSGESDDIHPAAATFLGIARGTATPLDANLERWLKGSNYKDRTKADARTAVANLSDWCAETGKPQTVEAIDSRTASDFRDNGLVARGVHVVTTNKKLSALRSYWGWLILNIDTPSNPWGGKSLRKPKRHGIDPASSEAPERPFTDAEVTLLMDGKADEDLADLMRIAALSGMRLEEIGQLKVEDCSEGAFSIRHGKTAAAVRKVPIHPALADIVTTRIKGARRDAYLFPKMKATGWDDNRTMAVSKRFLTYRRQCGVDDKRPGSRRSKVNFHSFRRWFATKAEEAEQPPHIIEVVLGHKGEHDMLKTYSRAILMEQRRRCVEAVALP